jgi:addiction module RelE/StbE family toxin
MLLKWATPAIRDLVSAGEFIAAENPAAAAKMAARIQEAVESLLEYPVIGREGRLADSRELVVTGTPFIVIYRLRMPMVQVLRVLHHARQWP